MTMKKLASLLFGIFGCINFLQAQGVRYIDEVFSSVTVQKDVIYGRNVPYASNDTTDLKCDIYMPSGDNATNRPVIILLHAGSFLPPASIPKPGLGTKEDSCIVHLCKAFARKGYVTISADYRVGWNPLASTQEERTRTIMSAVFRGVQDLKALVRYLNRYATTLGIDPTRIAAGGSNSGAYLGLHSAHFNKPAELSYPKFLGSNNQPLIDTVALGNFEGNSGNPGYPSNHRVTISLGGAIGDTMLMEAGEPPVIAMHGTVDNTPYMTGVVIVNVTGQPVIEVHGGHDLIRRNHNLGNQSIFLPDFASDNPFPALYPFYGKGFEPYGIYDDSTPAGIDSASKYLDTVITFLTPRLYKVMDIAAVSNEKPQNILKAMTKIYPNPANNYVTVSIEEVLPKIQTISIQDLTGRIVYQENCDCHTTRIDVSQLPKGLYLITLQNREASITEKLLVE